MAIGDASLPPAAWHFGVAMVASCSLVHLLCHRAMARRGCAFWIKEIENEESIFLSG